jgi:outer membrane protein insertion porin family
MTALFRLRLALLLSLFLLAPAWSQSGHQVPIQQLGDSARKLIAVKVTGSKRFTHDEVVGATGLQMGATVGDDDFKRAARNLGDTGAFSDISYTYSYSSAGTKLELQLTDYERFVPAHFIDFVWFSDAELRRKVKEHISLFNGELPTLGRLPDQVSDVLQALLVEDAIPGHVNYTRATHETGPLISFDYTVSDVLIRIHDMTFPGAGSNELPALESAAHRMSDRQYSGPRIQAFIERQLLPVFHARGYLKAAFAEPEPKVVKVAADESASDLPSLTNVDVTLPVAPGMQYKLSRLGWSGNREIPTDTLQTMVRAKLGEPANTVKIGEDLANVKTLYGSHGYITCQIKPEADFDDAAGTVAIRLDVKEEFAYHMGDLEYRGLDNGLTAKLRAAWKLRPGDVYDATYLSEYLREANKLLPPALDWDVTPHVTANVRDKSVDVDLNYSVKAAK